MAPGSQARREVNLILKKDGVESFRQFDTFDPHLLISVDKGWIDTYVEGDKINLKTYVPKDRLEQIQKEGLKLPKSHNQKRTDSDEGEGNAIFATTFQGWEDRAVIEFKVPLSLVTIRSTYRSQTTGLRFQLNAAVFVNSWRLHGRPPFDPRRSEFLIHHNVSPDSFTRIVRDQKSSWEQQTLMESAL